MPCETYGRWFRWKGIKIVSDLTTDTSSIVFSSNRSLLLDRITPCIATAVAAVKVGRPVRLNMERDVDMCVTGQRHPFRLAYKIGFTNEGRFTALDIRLWSNAGCSFDLSMPVLERAMLHIDNCYRFDNIQVRGRLCKTHLPSNTGSLGRCQRTRRRIESRLF